MKAIWKGAISFGLVNIPVKMYSASHSNTLDLDMLRKSDHCAVKYKRVCDGSDKEIPYKDIVKGYKYDGGDYVILSDKDFKNVNTEKTHTIDIIHFVNESEINSVYYEKPYFLEPEKSGSKPYALLREALKKSKKVGIAKFVLKSREHLGVIKLYDDSIILNEMRYPEEVRSDKDLTIPSEKKLSANEVDMAITLIKQLSHKFNPKEYKDTYHEDLMKIIEQKSKGKRIKPAGKPPKPTHSKNLMTLLKASIKKKAA